MGNNHLPTQTAVIKALGKLLGDDQAVFPGHKMSSVPGFYVANGLRNVSGPVIHVVNSDRDQVTAMLTDILKDKGFKFSHGSRVRSNQITVNYIPREAR